MSVEQFGAAPYGSMFLADLGAEVIKVENATSQGDPARQTGPYKLGTCDSEYFQTWNSNKKSIALDLKSEQGRAALAHLVSTSDAVLNNLRGDLSAKIGLDYAALSRIKPSIVCVHISAYGRDNERASWPGYDYLMQAESGLMSLTGEPDGPPTRTGGPSMIDHMTGMTAMIGLLSAIIQARATGQGCDVDTCLFDVALHQLGYTATWYLNEGHMPQRQSRSAHFSIAAVQTFPTSDGWIFIMCMTDKFWHSLTGVVGAPELSNDPRFATQAGRFQHRDELTGKLDKAFKRETTDYWLSKLEGVLPVAPVLDLAQALDNPFLKKNDMIRHFPHPEKPDMRILANPIKINGKRLQQAPCSPMGADTATFLAEVPGNLLKTG